MRRRHVAAIEKNISGKFLFFAGNVYIRTVKGRSKGKAALSKKQIYNLKTLEIMGLNCGCPAGPHLADLEIAECKETMGQVQKVIFQRVYESNGQLNRIEDPTSKALWAQLLSASDGSKAVVSPYIQNPTTEPGAARTFGGGNQTLGGIEITIGREPTNFSGVIYQESQKVIATLKQYMCENVGVYLIDENGNIGCLVDDMDDPTEFKPIPIGKMFVGDKKLGGYEEPDSNTIEWSFFPNWSDKFFIVKRGNMDFNPLTDLVNVSSDEQEPSGPDNPPVGM